ncbi:MAG: hypothetical protein HY527_21455 [Betaproteobacteria bacterium]|nr:hypothetical protein [Betaproteobacteria bacterium]
MARERLDPEVSNFLARLAITVFGLFLAIFLVRNWGEAKARYVELEAQSPFTAWVVKWGAIIILFITASTIATIGYIIYKAARGEL